MIGKGSKGMGRGVLVKGRSRDSTFLPNTMSTCTSQLVSSRHSFVHFHFSGRILPQCLLPTSSATAHLPFRSTGVAPSCLVWL